MNATEYSYLFLVALPLVAFLYASVGHGGASGYLALMALFSFTPEVMKPTALVLNLFVAAISFYYYYRSGYFTLSLFWPFALTSIPAAFIGGMIAIDAGLYKKILAALLIFAVLRMLNFFGKENTEKKKVIIWQSLVIGGFVGFFSGLIGIGGGIILTPLILLLHWGSMKEAAAVSALFIWVNSASGLVGQFSTGLKLSPDLYILVSLAVIGGALGGYFGSNKLENYTLKYVLATVILIACIKLIFV